MVLDGAMGTTIQEYKFDEEAFRGARLSACDAGGRRRPGLK